MSSLSVKLLEVANEFEDRRQREVQEYKQEINALHLENIKLKSEMESQRYRIDDLVEHSQSLAATLAQQSRQQNVEQEALARELVAAQFELRELHDLRAAAARSRRAAIARAKHASASSSSSATAVSSSAADAASDENADPNNAPSAPAAAAARSHNKGSAVDGDGEAAAEERPSPYPSQEELFAAAAAGDVDTVRSLLQPKLALTIPGSGDRAGGPTAAGGSGSGSSTPSASEGAPSFFEDVLGRALVRACEFGRGVVSHALLEMGANVRAVDPADATRQPPLHKAAAAGSADLLKVLLAKHPRGLDEVDAGPAGETLLHVCARGDHADCVEMLLLAGCDVGVRNKAGVTAEEVLAARTAAAQEAAEADGGDGSDGGEAEKQQEGDGGGSGDDDGGGAEREGDAEEGEHEGDSAKAKKKKKKKAAAKKKAAKKPPRQLQPIEVPRSLVVLRDVQFWNSCAFGNRKYQTSDFPRAFEVFTRAIRLSEPGAAGEAIQISAKDAATIRYNCARAALHMEAYLEAVDYCEKSTAFLADFLKAWKLRGECFMHLCDYASAISSFKSALAISPADAKAAQYLARAEELNSQSHYNVGVAATEKEIKKAYRKMCLLWHPDKHNQSKDSQHRASCVFKCIKTAYEELSDPLKRIMYDMELRRQGRYESTGPAGGVGSASGEPGAQASGQGQGQAGDSKVSESKTSRHTQDRRGSGGHAEAPYAHRRAAQPPHSHRHYDGRQQQQQQQQHRQQQPSSYQSAPYVPSAASASSAAAHGFEQGHRFDVHGGLDGVGGTNRGGGRRVYDDDDDDLSFDRAMGADGGAADDDFGGGGGGDDDDDDLDSIDEWAHPQEVDASSYDYEDDFVAYSRHAGRRAEREEEAAAGRHYRRPQQHQRRPRASAREAPYGEGGEHQWSSRPQPPPQQQRPSPSRPSRPARGASGARAAADPHAQFDVHDYDFDYVPQYTD